MTRDEIWDLLGAIAAVDLRKLGPTDADLWESLVGDLNYDDACKAVAAYFRESRERIMPVDIRQRVRAMQEERINRTPIEPPPAELTDDPQAYLKHLRGSIADASVPSARPAIEASR